MFDAIYLVAFLVLGWMAFAAYSALALFLAVPKQGQHWFAHFVLWHGRVVIFVAAAFAALLILKAFAVLIRSLVVGSA